MLICEFTRSPHHQITKFCGVWLASLLTSPRNWIDLGGAQVAFDPAWRGFARIMLVVLVVGTVTSSVNVFRPYWTPLRAALRLACDAAGAVR
jgi:hypothetical protein